MSDYDSADIARLHDLCSVRKPISADADHSLEALFLRTESARLAVLDATKAFQKAHLAFLSAGKTLKEMPADDTPRRRQAAEADAEETQETLKAARREVDRRCEEWRALDNCTDKAAKLHQARITERAGAAQEKAFAVAAAELKEQPENVTFNTCHKSGTTCSGQPAALEICKVCCEATATHCFPGKPDTPPPETVARPSSPRNHQAPKPETPPQYTASARVEKDGKEDDIGDVKIVQLTKIKKALKHMSDTFYAGSPGDEKHDGLRPGVLTAHLGGIMKTTGQSAATLHNMASHVHMTRQALERIATVAEAFAMALTGTPAEHRKTGDVDGPKTSGSKRTPVSSASDSEPRETRRVRVSTGAVKRLAPDSDDDHADFDDVFIRRRDSKVARHVSPPRPAVPAIPSTSQAQHPTTPIGRAVAVNLVPLNMLPIALEDVTDHDGPHDESVQEHLEHDKLHTKMKHERHDIKRLQAAADTRSEAAAAKKSAASHGSNAKVTNNIVPSALQGASIATQSSSTVSDVVEIGSKYDYVIPIPFKLAEPVIMQCIELCICYLQDGAQVPYRVGTTVLRFVDSFPNDVDCQRLRAVASYVRGHIAPKPQKAAA